MYTNFPPGRSGDQDAVLDRQGIGWQALDVPVADSSDIYQEWDDVQVLGDRNLPQLLSSSGKIRVQPMCVVGSDSMPEPRVRD